MHILFIVVAVLAGAGEQVLTFKLFFGDFADYVDAWKYYFTPDFWSFIKGEYSDDVWAEFQLVIYHAAGIITGILVYSGFGKLFS